MINYKNKFIFIHIPKCGGTSVESTLFIPASQRTAKDLWMFPNKYQSGGLQHLKAIHIREEVGPTIFDDCFKFSFVRNPWDKLVSQYHYTVHVREDLRKWIGINSDDSFQKYIKRLIESEVHVQWDHQYKFLYDLDGNKMVDFIGKLENYQEDFNIVCDKIGVPRQKLPHQNKTKHKHYTEYYDDETRDIVAKKYSKDIELFSYKFGG